MQPVTSPPPQTLPEITAFLHEVSVFSETPDAVLSRVATLLDPVEAPAGTIILTRGEPGDCMYIIVEGRVRVYDGELIFNHLGPREVFGEVALLDLETRSATVMAEEDSKLYRLQQRALYDLMGTQPEVAHGIIQVLSRYLRGLVRDMTDDFEYMQQFTRVIAAAQAVEAGDYRQEMLDEVALRPDALGQLARVFQQMAQEILTRELQLRQQVQSLQIQIDKGQRSREVDSITETEYFRNLQQLARDIRQRRDLQTSLQG